MKQKLALALNNFLEPIRERRANHQSHRDEVLAAVEKGCTEGRQIGRETMAMVKNAMHNNYLKRS